MAPRERAIMTTRILGIDPSLVKSGFGLLAVRNGEIESWQSWSFPTDKRGTIEDRVTAIHNQVRNSIINRDVHMVAMESGFVRADHGQTSLKLGYVRAACMIAARSMEKPFFQYTPQQAKQAATSYGGAGKDQVMDAMTMILKASTRIPSDEADALAVAFCHWNRMDEAALISASVAGSNS